MGLQQAVSAGIGCFSPPMGQSGFASDSPQIQCPAMGPADPCLSSPGCAVQGKSAPGALTQPSTLGLSLSTQPQPPPQQLSSPSGMQRTRTALRLSLLLLSSSALAVTPLGDWQTGIGTNYGGAADGMNPYSPSFGTQDVRALLLSACLLLPACCWLPSKLSGCGC